MLKLKGSAALLAATGTMRSCLAPADLVPMILPKKPGERNRKTSASYDLQKATFEAAELKRARKAQKLAILAGKTTEDML